MSTTWTIPAATAPSPPTLTEAQRRLFGRDVRFRTDYTVTPSKDYGVVDELEAVKQSVFHEAQTSPGELVFRPDYGMGISDAVKKARSQSLIDQMQNRIRERLAANPRISAIHEVLVEPVTTDDGKPGTRILIRVEAGGRPITINEVLS